MKVLSFIDFLMVPFWATMIIIIAKYIAQVRYANDPCQRYFVLGLILKMIGGIMVGVIYQYYYSGGDTIIYYISSNSLLSYIEAYPQKGIYLLLGFSEPGSHEYSEFVKYNFLHKTYFIDGEQNAAVARFITPFNALTFRSYYATTIFISTFSYIGIWGIFRTLYKQYPKHLTSIAIGVLFIPSLVFWGSGILKDSITIGIIGIIVYTISEFLRLGLFKNTYRILIILVLGFLAFKIKAYIVMSLIGIGSLWIVLSVQSKIKNIGLKIILMPIIIFLGAFSVFIGLQTLGEQTARYRLENVLETAQIVQSDLIKDYYYDSGETKGSRYDIGAFDPSIGGVASKFPIAVFTTFYRPFLWEVNSILVLFSAIESLAFLALTLRMFLRIGVFKFFKVVFSNPLLTFSFVYAIFFGFMVGLTAGNFGNLSRYRIPTIPFLIPVILIAEKEGRKKPVRSENTQTAFKPLMQLR